MDMLGDTSYSTLYIDKENQKCKLGWSQQTPVASFTKEVNRRLAKRPLFFNGCLANHRLTSLVKEATGVNIINPLGSEMF